MSYWLGSGKSIVVRVKKRVVKRRSSRRKKRR